MGYLKSKNVKSASGNILCNKPKHKSSYKYRTIRSRKLQMGLKSHLTVPLPSKKTEVNIIGLFWPTNCLSY